MTKKYRLHLLLSGLIIILPMMIGTILWRNFPEKMVTHWNLKGQADGFMGKGFIIYGIPMISLVLHFLVIIFTMKDRKNRKQSEKIILMLFWMLPVVSLAVWAGICSTVWGNSIDTVKLTLIIIPIMFVIIGNYMPKCKQNYTIGIRVVWALKNEENWNKTHRFAGRFWVFSGSIFTILILLVPLDNMVPVLGFISLFLALIPVLYSYLYYKKQLKEGRVTKEEIRYSSKEKKISIIVTIFIIVVLLLIFCKGRYEIDLQEKSFTIQADLWEDITVAYDNIEEIEYLPRKKEGRRVMGFGSLDLVMGLCENNTWGNYTAYLNLKTEPCILLNVDGKILVINEGNEEATRQLYENLISRWKAD